MNEEGILTLAAFCITTSPVLQVVVAPEERPTQTSWVETIRNHGRGFRCRYDF
jgi:hypothetical protein